jgi:hypothetical protein
MNRLPAPSRLYYNGGPPEKSCENLGLQKKAIRYVQELVAW